MKKLSENKNMWFLEMSVYYQILGMQFNRKFKIYSKLKTVQNIYHGWFLYR